MYHDLTYSYVMEPFTYLKTYRVPVCKECELTCVANKVPTHLQTRHRDIPPVERRRNQRPIGAIGFSVSSSYHK
ncbi:Uncharacterized protein HZ326_22087 [Fusarium oxysporum f. sp. albedinis]|nr:hypothetical protein HZ326_23702 [Fusarium oxysporum f. sp. albedinis]KAJ0134853.1 Uncharacterized protein HZ326_22087 [Fusarium oxysporum f. sp. albedinis]